MRPSDTITVRGIHTKRVTVDRELSTGRTLPYTTRCAILAQLLNADPTGD